MCTHTFMQLIINKKRDFHLESEEDMGGVLERVPGKSKERERDQMEGESDVILFQLKTVWP